MYLCTVIINSKNMDNKRKEKFGDLLLGISKYIITAIILTSLFNDIGDWKWYTYILSSLAVAATILGALSLYKEDEITVNKRQKNQKRRKG